MLKLEIHMGKSFTFMAGALVYMLLLFSTQAIASVVLLLPNGERISQGMMLPPGYYWLDDGTLVTPQKIMVGKNGDIQSYPPDLPLYSLKNVRQSSLKLPDNCLIAYEPDSYNALTTVPDNGGRYGGYSGGGNSMLLIPEDAMMNNDLSFINGCWRSDGINYYTDPRRPYVAPAEFCFNSTGNGSFYAFPKGTKCVSNANAFFRGSMLIINTYKGTCADPSRFLMPRTFQCEGTGENTMCYTVAKYNDQVFHDRAIFYRK